MKTRKYQSTRTSIVVHLNGREAAALAEQKRRETAIAWSIFGVLLLIGLAITYWYIAIPLGLLAAFALFGRHLEKNEAKAKAAAAATPTTRCSHCSAPRPSGGPCAYCNTP